MSKKAKTAKVGELLPQLDGTIFERKVDDAISEGANRANNKCCRPPHVTRHYPHEHYA